MKKRILAVLLAAAMCLSVIPGFFITTARAGGRGCALVDEDGTIHALYDYGVQSVTDPSGKTNEFQYDTDIIDGQGWSYSFSDERLTLNGYRGRFICGNIHELVLAAGSENYLSAMCLDGSYLECVRVSGSGALTLEYNEEILNPSDGSHLAKYYSWKSHLGKGDYSQFASHCVVFDCYLGSGEYTYPECKLEFADGLSMVGGVEKGNTQTVLMTDRSDLKEDSKFLMSETADGKPASYVRIAPLSSSSQPATPDKTLNLPTVEDIPASGTAYARTQMVKLDSKDVQFRCYAVKNADGNETNYVKIRDLANALNGTKAQFNVDWDQANKLSILIPNSAYIKVENEGVTPYSGNQPYKAVSDNPIIFIADDEDGGAVHLTSFVITYQGGGYTYYKLADLGQLLNFEVRWDVNTKSVVIETDKPFTGK